MVKMTKGWEASFQSAVKVRKLGWNVTDNNGKILLRIRGKDI
uniref:Uncharacterized protein n=1 Tax=Prochlorococcus marinus str. P0902-H212 TaxID=1620696 RepID=A0A0D5A1Q9_PROMR|nr:hypothetical protein FA02_0199 [Prochlorococcus marinus str. P0902-H212]